MGLIHTIQTNLVKRITERSFSDTVEKKDFKNNDASSALDYNMQLISTSGAQTFIQLLHGVLILFVVTV